MPVLLNLYLFARRDDFSMDGTGVPVPEHLWFVGQVPDLPLLQTLSMAGREPAPQPSPNVETPDRDRNCFLRGDDRLRRSRAVPQNLHLLWGYYVVARVEQDVSLAEHLGIMGKGPVFSCWQ